jgi:hypothetical protein
MESHHRTCAWRGNNSIAEIWEEIPDAYHNPEVAESHLEMIRPILEGARLLMGENPGQFPLLEKAFQDYLIDAQREK